MRKKNAVKLLFFAWLLLPLAAQAEYRRIELTIFGMD
jgi:hypothetical protein